MDEFLDARLRRRACRKRRDRIESPDATRYKTDTGTSTCATNTRLLSSSSFRSRRAFGRDRGLHRRYSCDTVGCSTTCDVSTTSRLSGISGSAASPLRGMIARFAPADIGADLSALPDNERQALAQLVEAARIMDALFLRQVWSGNEALLESLARQAVAGEAADTLHYFLINKGPWSRLDHHKPFVPGVPAKPEGANFYPAGATKDEIEKWLNSLPGDAKKAASGFFTTIRRGPDGRFMAVPYSVEYQGELALAASLLREAARPHHAADAQGVPDQPRRRLHLERLLRERRRVDGARCVDRADDRALRGLRGRVVQLQGGVRSVHHDSRRGRVEEAAGVRRRAAGTRERAADRSCAPESQARRARADQGRQRRLHRRRRQPRRPDRGVQPSQRRARRQGKGHEAGDVEERAGSQVQDGARADRESGAAGARSRRTSRSTRSSRTS